MERGVRGVSSVKCCEGVYHRSIIFVRQSLGYMYVKLESTSKSVLSNFRSPRDEHVVSREGTTPSWIPELPKAKIAASSLNFIYQDNADVHINQLSNFTQFQIQTPSGYLL